jgi:hypothetical protein
MVTNGRLRQRTQREHDTRSLKTGEVWAQIGNQLKSQGNPETVKVANPAKTRSEPQVKMLKSPLVPLVTDDPCSGFEL